jgi:hypothetical protein
MTITLSGLPYTYLGGSGGRASPARASGGLPEEVDEDYDRAGGCLVTVQATQGSSAQVATEGTLGPQACPTATRAADVIARQLPDGRRGASARHPQ